MSRLGRLCLILVLCVSGGSSLAAQDVYVQNISEDVVILPIGLRSWEGTQQEQRRINRVPVPSSYRERCAREELSYTTIHTAVTKYRCYRDLMTWHFNFGTAHSSEKALSYIAELMTDEYDLSAGAGQRYTELLPQGLAEGEAYLNVENLTYETFLEENRVIDASLYPALAELRDLSQILDKTSDLAEFYIDAADWHRSPSLLDEATRWYGSLPRSEPLVAEERSSGPEQLLRRVASFRQGEFLGLSLAVARAATERTEKSVLAAHEWSGRAFDPEFRYRELRDYSIRSRAERYRYFRFRIQLLAQIHDLDVREHEEMYLGDYDFMDMENLFRQEDRSPSDMRYTDAGATRRFIEAIVAHSEIAVQAAPTCNDEHYDFSEELGILFNGGLIVAQAKKPAPYRRVAELYLELFSTLQKCEDGKIFWFLNRAQYHNQARHYQHFLDNYDEIALGR